MAKKNKKVSIFEVIWYLICGLVILWGITYVALSLIDKYNDLADLHKFATKFESAFKLSLYFWGLIIIAIGAVAAVVVMIIFAKTFDRAADREQRRSARLSGLNKKEDKVVAEQKPEVVEEKPEEQPKVEEPAPVEEVPVEEPVQEEPQSEEQPAEETKEEPAEEPAPAEETPAEEEAAPEEEKPEEKAE